MKRVSRFLIVLLVVGVSAAVVLPSIRADEHPQDRCSDQTLRGGYAYSAEGYVGQAPGSFTPIAEAGVYDFDGSGNFSTKNTISVGGTIIPRTAIGTYTVSGDCTGTASITGGVTFAFAIERRASGMHLVVTTPTVTVRGTMDQQ
jgi:hypothetical protein